MCKAVIHHAHRRDKMSYICNKCGTTFNSPVCPNCGTLAQQPANSQPIQPIPPKQPYNGAYPQNQYIPNPNIIHPAKKKKHGCLLWGFIVLFIIMGLLFFSAIFTSCIRAFSEGFKEGYDNANSAAVSDDIIVDDDTAGSGDTDDITATLTPTITLAPDEYLSDDEIQYLYSDTKKYIGKHVKISGIVFGNPESDENGIYFQMFQDAANNENSTIVAYKGIFDIKDGDYVIIDGIVDREAKGDNYFGASLSAPGIIADSIEISTYQDVVSPAEKTINLNKSHEQYGYEVTVEKIEFSPIETRVYVTINNNGKSNFSAYAFNMKIKQGRSQYEEQSNWNYDYPEVQTDLMPNTTTSGVVCFPVISQTDKFTLYIDGSSDNWDEDLEQYVFKISNE
jgi:hypothetical protein